MAMDVSYINPFIDSTVNAFATMVNVSLVCGKPYLRHRNQKTHPLYKVSAVISFSGGAQGLVALNLSERVALTLAAGLVGTPFSALDDDCLDAVREIANMIAGGAKRKFPGKQIAMTVPMTLPTPHVVFPGDKPIIGIPFDTPKGWFAIEVLLEN